MKNNNIMTKAFVLVCLVALLVSCDNDNTGGPTNRDISNAQQAEAKGETYIVVPGKGKLELRLKSTYLSVGQEAGFYVTLTDPEGKPIVNERVTCFCENHLAILDPAVRSVNNEGITTDALTNTYGVMSGRIGGNVNGSGIFRCAATSIPSLSKERFVSVHGDGIGFPNSPTGAILGGGTNYTSSKEDQASATLRPSTVVGYSKDAGSAAVGVTVECLGEGKVAVINDSGSLIRILKIDGKPVEIGISSSASAVVTSLDTLHVYNASNGQDFSFKPSTCAAKR